MKTLRYKHRSIGSVASLSKSLGFSIDVLLKTASTSGEFYVPNEPRIKPNGGIRQTYTIREPLYSIQESICHKIIDRVDFPEYLQGAIKDLELPRDYVRDANLHSDAIALLKMDISKFFSSTRSALVYRVWKYFFQFPHEVSEILTELTTYNNFIPEGAPTSSAVANLIFWDYEPTLELELRQQGYVYSRIIDDITVSFINQVTKQVRQEITAEIYGMFIRAGLKPNREKRKFQTKNQSMTVHKLNINSGRPTIPKNKRANIRAAVKQLENLANSTKSWSDIKEKFEQATGRVNLLKRLHPHQAAPYLEQLKIIKNKLAKNNE